MHQLYVQPVVDVRAALVDELVLVVYLLVLLSLLEDTKALQSLLVLDFIALQLRCIVAAQL